MLYRHVAFVLCGLIIVNWSYVICWYILVYTGTLEGGEEA